MMNSGSDFTVWHLKRAKRLRCTGNKKNVWCNWKHYNINRNLSMSLFVPYPETVTWMCPLVYMQSAKMKIQSVLWNGKFTPLSSLCWYFLFPVMWVPTWQGEQVRFKDIYTLKNVLDINSNWVIEKVSYLDKNILLLYQVRHASAFAFLPQFM